MEEHLGPIPKEFYSFDTNKPFTHCLICGCDLTTGFQEYFIEKAIRNYPEHEVHDVVYEYAMCLTCARSMNEKMSLESTRKIHEYFSQKNEFVQAVNGYRKSETTVDAPDLTQCLITNTPTAEMDEYMIYGHFRGDKMILSSMPYVLNGTVMDEVSGLLSAQTIDEIDDFAGKYFGGPPELEELWTPRRPVFF